MTSRTPAKSGAKPTLDKEAFIDAGLRMAARPETTTVTNRALGKEVGVDPTAVYRHFPNKEVLMRALLDRLFQLACSKVTVDLDRWEDRLVEFAEITLDTFQEYPSIAATATTLTTQGPGELDSIELILECFHRAGLSGQALAEDYSTFGAYVLSGAASLSAPLPASKNERRAWFSGALSADPARYPLTASIRDDILSLDHREIYLRGARQLVRSAVGPEGLEPPTLSV
ncbi:hypothetical protein GCM10009662_85220 [Catellatospora coxensis]|uniref:TetR/AcrR family transcriptional regulator n=1 Tax=Catellatospora coxensis TaxID=310354 RepID=UPI0031D50953